MQELEIFIMETTIDEHDIEQFNKPNQDWWDENGSFSSLHKITPCRIEYIIQVIKKNIIKQKKYENHQICSNLKVLDIGCGGGILCEPLAKLGGEVTGIDASSNAIKTAKDHARIMGLKINYKCTSIEKFTSKKSGYDLVIASEVIEHVANRKIFFENIHKICTNETSIVFTTLNKSLPGIVFGKFAAEYILKLIPKETHDWRKFVTPKDLHNEARECGILLNSFIGIVPDFLNNEFKLSSFLGINYAASGVILK